MYFKFLAITVIVGIILHETYSGRCCCSGKCQKRNERNTDDRRDYGPEGHNRSLCSSPSFCSIPNHPRQNHLKLASYPALGGVLRPVGKHYPPVLPSSTCPPLRCPRPPPCPKIACPSLPPPPPRPGKVCPSLAPCSKKFCPLPPPCPKKVCPPSRPYHKNFYSIIPPSPSPYPRKLHPLPPSPYSSVARRPELNRYSSYNHRKTDRRHEEREQKETQYFGAKYDTDREYTNVKSKIANFPKQENYHNIVRRLANTSNELLLNSDEINNAEFLCNNERLREIMIANMDDDPKLSKELIQIAAQEKFNKNFNVICSNDTFAYSTYTDTYCEVNSEGVTCFAFKVG